MGDDQIEKINSSDLSIKTLHMNFGTLLCHANHVKIGKQIHQNRNKAMLMEAVMPKRAASASDWAGQLLE